MEIPEGFCRRSSLNPFQPIVVWDPQNLTEFYLWSYGWTIKLQDSTIIQRDDCYGIWQGRLFIRRSQHASACNARSYGTQNVPEGDHRPNHSINGWYVMPI